MLPVHYVHAKMRHWRTKGLPQVKFSRVNTKPSYIASTAALEQANKQHPEGIPGAHAVSAHHNHVTSAQRILGSINRQHNLSELDSETDRHCCLGVCLPPTHDLGVSEGGDDEEAGTVAPAVPPARASTTRSSGAVLLQLLLL